MVQRWPLQGDVKTIVERASTDPNDKSQMVEALTGLSHKDIQITVENPIKGEQAIDSYFEGQLKTQLVGLWVKNGMRDGVGGVAIQPYEFKPQSEADAREEIRLMEEMKDSAPSLLSSLAYGATAVTLLFSF